MRFPYQKVAAQGYQASVSFPSGAGMAELVDAPDSKSGGVKPVRVRVSLPAPSAVADLALPSSNSTLLETLVPTPPNKFCSQCGAPVQRRIPDGEDREREVCPVCHFIHYRNPIPVVGCVAEHDGRILLCRRAIDPRLGYWTVPAGFMELNETLEEAALRETREEACAEIRLGDLYSIVDVPRAGQVHFFFRGEVIGGKFAPGIESLETRLFAPNEIPFDQIAFRSGIIALRRYLDGSGKGVTLDAVLPIAAD